MSVQSQAAMSACGQSGQLVMGTGTSEFMHRFDHAGPALATAPATTLRHQIAMIARQLLQGAASLLGQPLSMCYVPDVGRFNLVCVRHFRIPPKQTASFGRRMTLCDDIFYAECRK